MGRKHRGMFLASTRPSLHWKGPTMTRRISSGVGLAAGLALTAVLAVTFTSAEPPAAGRKVFNNSVIPLPATGVVAPHGLVVNAAVQDHSKDKMDVLFSLAIPDDVQEKLEELVLKGEIVDPKDLAK